MIKTQVRWENSIVDLRQLAIDIARDVMASAMERVAKLMVALIKDRAPVRDVRYWSVRDPVPPGALARSISFKVIINLRKGIGTAIVGPRRGAPGLPSRYAHLVEFGHIVVIPNGHGGTRTAGHAPAYPFMRPAVAAFRAAALQVFGEEFANGISLKLSRRVGKKTVTTLY